MAWTDWARQVLAAFDDFQLLCAVRKGPWASKKTSTRASPPALQRRGLLESDQGWYEGRPVPDSPATTTAWG